MCVDPLSNLERNESKQKYHVNGLKELAYKSLATDTFTLSENERESIQKKQKKTHPNYDIETANESATVQSNTKNELQFCAQLMTFLFQCKMVSLTLSKSQSNDFAFQINAIELGVCRSEDRLCECVRASMYFHSNGIFASLGI